VARLLKYYTIKKVFMPVARYKIRQLNTDTYAIEEKTPISQGLCYLLLGQEKALMIDTGFGFKRLLPTVKSLTNLPISVANTHAHVDHIGGNHLFDEIWLHKDDREVFALHTDPNYTMGLLGENISLPLRAVLGKLLKNLLTIDNSGEYTFFEDGYIFKLGGRDIEAISTPGHTPGSVCFLDPVARMLFSGDTVCEWGILLHLKQECCTPGVFLSSMRRLKSIYNSFDTMWPGHHGFPADKSLIDEYECCAAQIVNGTAKIDTDKGRLCAKYKRILITLPEGYNYK
jgi:glyoxylase-like metal-dependent hydrolase (beta-lactamase superfamily II)